MYSSEPKLNLRQNKISPDRDTILNFRLVACLPMHVVQKVVQIAVELRQHRTLQRKSAEEERIRPTVNG